MEVIMKMNEDVKKLLDSSAAIVNNKYYFLPYWFEKINESEYRLHRLGNLPKELEMELESHRDALKSIMPLSEFKSAQKDLVEASRPPGKYVDLRYVREATEAIMKTDNKNKEEIMKILLDLLFKKEASRDI